MFWFHELRAGVLSSITVNPTGMVTTETDYLGAKRVTETVAFDHTVHYYRVNKNAYPDDLAIGFKHVDDEHGAVRQYAFGVRDWAKGFHDVWGYNVRMRVETSTEKGGGFELIFETRNLRSRVCVWNETERPEDWRWDDGLRARKNVYLSSKFEDYFEQERLTMRQLKKWAEDSYGEQQRLNQDKIQADVEYAKGLGVT